MRALLAFDTATEHLSIALEVHGRVATHESAGGAQASATLIPTLLAMLAAAGIRLRDLDAIAFGRGPGAFTGLRTACSVAQGLALGAELPVLPIDTLLAVAEDARVQLHAAGSASAAEPMLRIWATLDARMNEIYAAQYGWCRGAWTVLDAPQLLDAPALNQRWHRQAPQVVAGNALVAFGARLTPGSAHCLPSALPRATALLPLAHALWAQGGAVDAELALPLYLRDKVAQTTLERQALRAAKDALEGQA
jgi:tRNA threonylcarbamoyladenosine biosynthesis protein TsaB